jgi:carboxymethylenebutenolidase
MAQTLDLIAADGHRLAAYLATPAGTPRGALVVLQEIFGVNSHIRAVADAYAADGYLAIAPAMFDRAERGVELGYTPDEVQRGQALKAACADAPALLDIAAAVAHGRTAGRVGIVGYCWGGYLSWLASGAVDGLAASIPYYGGGMPQRADVQPRCPVLAHFGEKDGHIPVDGVNALQAAHPAIAVHLYPAGHGFNRDVTAAYDGPSARLARERTLAFLHQHVG